MLDEIEKSEPSPDDVLAAIQSFNDPSIITNLFRQLGWSYSIEIKETVKLAQQNTNSSVKFKAIKYLRELLREAAETAGYTAKVSQTFPNAQGGSTTFSAKRIAGILNPTKQIESTIKEPENDKKETRTEPNRESDRRPSDSSCEINQRGTSKGGQGCEERSTKRNNSNSDEPILDTRRAFPPGDADSGGTEPPDGGETPRPVPGGTPNDDAHPQNSENPCIKTRPPTCDQDLFPGISSAED
jgi:metal-sulfur cluster biosynthetic enzyme